MPPKRRSTGPSAPSSKKAKATPEPTREEETYKPPRSERWSAVSASANAEADYRIRWKDEKKAYSYITLCRALYLEDDDDEDEDEDEEDEEEEEEEEEEGDEGEEEESDASDQIGPRCGKKRCVCFKPLAANPDHPWVISQAGFWKFDAQSIHSSLRIPDNFSMYTFNDHTAYGSIQVIQNLFLDFEEAAKEKRGEWREQWAVCEGTVHWLLHSAGSDYMQIGDADYAHNTAKLVGRMFLAMLAQLDDLGLMGDGTEVKSLGCTMAMYIALAAEMREFGVLGRSRRKYTGKKALQPDFFDDAVLSYANKRGVTLRGSPNIEELVADLVADVELPQKNAKDPWAWKAEFKKYEKMYAGVAPYVKATASIGGDSLDITTWSAAQRKQASFDKKDPIGKASMDAIKKGLVMQLA